MSRKESLQLAMHCLSHPASVAAVLLVLLNDHLLRRLWPSWLTGKIGDFAWLVFAPFALATLLVWVTPPSIARHQRRLGALAVALVGLEFALAKTIPFFHSLTLQVIEWMTAWPSILHRDPTDLAALPALLISWQVWKTSKQRAQNALPSGWVVLGLAMLATMADSGAPDYGIHCVVESDGTLYAFAVYPDNYFSTDGGNEWHVNTKEYPSDGCDLGWRDESWQMTDPNNPDTVYRFAPGVSIEKSNDAGQTWRTEVDLTWEQARILHHDRKYSSSYGSLTPGPIDAVIHSDTGNIIVAMGQQGILLGSPDGNWEWVGVGRYFRDQPSNVDDIVSLLNTEFWLSFILVLLTIGSFFWRTRKQNFRKFGTWLRILLLAIIWATWMFSAIYMAPATHNNFGYTWAFILPPIWFVALLGAPLSIEGLLHIYHISRHGLVVIVVTALSTALLYLLPYLIWSVGGIPRYNTASVFAVILILATLYAGDRYLHRTLQRSQPSNVESR
jgi:hypothetical protein